MKKYIPLKIKMCIANILFFLFDFIPKIFFLRKIEKKDKIILLEIPTYSNLGDQAISYAERKFFQDKFPNRLLYEVEGYYYYWYQKWLLKYTKKTDLFVLIGGGNFGNQYNDIEKRRIHILNYFKERPIVCFPQTVYYTLDYKGKEAVKTMQEAMAKNKRAVFFIREQTSKELFEKYFNRNAVLVPDIVLYLEKNTYKKRKKQLLLCMRNDCEVNKDLREDIRKCFREYFENIIETDTCVQYSVDNKNIDIILKEKWKEFQESQVVITDRLHGMIFALITGTPCIVLPNYNHKITSFYDTWLKDIEYIFYAACLDDVKKIINNIDMNKEYYYDRKVFENYFDIIEKTLKEVLHEYQK